MKHTIKFRVDGEAVPSPRPRICTKNGKSWAYYSDTKYTVFMKAIKAACPEKHHFEDAQVKIYFISAKKGDVDNLAKGVLDALTGVLWDNDKVVWDLHLIRLENKPHGGHVPGACHVEVEVIGDEPAHKQKKLV